MFRRADGILNQPNQLKWSSDLIPSSLFIQLALVIYVPCNQAINEKCNQPINPSTRKPVLVYRTHFIFAYFSSVKFDHKSFIWLQVTELLSSLGFLSFLESGYGCVEAGPNLVDKLQAAISRGEDRYSVLPARTTEIEILTVPDADGQAPGTCGCFCGVYILNDGKCQKSRVLLVLRSFFTGSFLSSHYIFCMHHM